MLEFDVQCTVFQAHASPLLRMSRYLIKFIACALQLGVLRCMDCVLSGGNSLSVFSSISPCINAPDADYVIDCNHYTDKGAVWLSAGPENKALPKGSYIFIVLAVCTACCLTNAICTCHNMNNTPIIADQDACV